MKNRKVVITGRGLVTPLGFGLEANVEALKAARSGISYNEKYAEMGLDSCVTGSIRYEYDCPVFERKKLRFMPENAKYAVAAAYQAIIEAGYTPETLPGEEMAVINGCAGSAYAEVCGSVAAYLEGGKILRRVSPFSVPRVMPSSAVSNLSLVYGIKGESYDISCACTSGALAIIDAARLIESGEYDIVLAGGSEEVSWQQALGFNAMKALSHSYNSTPEKASRAFDSARDGFVIAEGAGMVILESEEHAKARGARVISEVKGWASNSNATDMVAPDAAASADVMRKAVRNASLEPSDITYINTHGTSTGIGDPVELTAIREVFGEGGNVAINSTKSLTGHTIGAAGAIEGIFCSLMIEHGFISESANVEKVIEGFEWADIVRATREGIDVRYALSNSFGFGGTNASIVFAKYEG